MRKWLDLFENPNVVRVFHGDTKPDVVVHSQMFFSTSRDFASDYGKHITEYDLNVSNMIDSLDEDLISDHLPLYDPHADVELSTIEEYMDRSSDTWEILEVDGLALSLVHSHGADGIIVYEGGVRNYFVVNTHALKLTMSDK